MITRTVQLQLAALALVALLGVTYVGLRYANLGSLFSSTTYPVTMQMTQSGGHLQGRRRHLPGG